MDYRGRVSKPSSSITTPNAFEFLGCDSRNSIACRIAAAGDIGPEARERLNARLADALMDGIARSPQARAWRGSHGGATLRLRLSAGALTFRSTPP